MNAHARFISEERVQRALDFLADSAAPLGEARRRARKDEHMIKHIEALMFKASSSSSNEMRKADARTSEQYLAAIDEDAEATGELAKLYSLREAANDLIEAWRSQEANFRGMRL